MSEDCNIVRKEAEYPPTGIGECHISVRYYDHRMEFECYYCDSSSTDKPPILYFETEHEESEERISRGKSTTNFKEAKTYLHGHIKWDGCANFNDEHDDYEPDNYARHICGLYHKESELKLWMRLYDLASEIPSWDGNKEELKYFSVKI